MVENKDLVVTKVSTLSMVVGSDPRQSGIVDKTCEPLERLRGLWNRWLSVAYFVLPLFRFLSKSIGAKIEVIR